jgi:hypothetical protein
MVSQRREHKIPESEKGIEGQVKEIIQKPKSFKSNKLDADMFLMRRTYHANGTAPDFKK